MERRLEPAAVYHMARAMGLSELGTESEHEGPAAPHRRALSAVA